MESFKWLCQRVVPLAFAALSACAPAQTAIILEANSDLPANAVDEVAFKVRRTDLADEGREALTPLTGPDARTFPLRLVLVSDRDSAARFSVSVEGRKAGAVTATGVPESDGGPIVFVPGQVVKHSFRLRPRSAGEAGTTSTGTAPGPDAGAAPAPSAMPATPATPPAPGPGGACGGPSGACASGLTCLAGRCCASDCRQDCLAGTCDASGVCQSLPDGTPCHGSSGMTCHQARCTKHDEH
jgi:hypothetical protein